MDLSKIEQLIIDEADKLFDHGFAEQTDEILTHCTNPKIRKSIFQPQFLLVLKKWLIL